MPADGTLAVIAPAEISAFFPRQMSRENTASGHKQKQVCSGPNAEASFMPASMSGKSGQPPAIPSKAAFTLRATQAGVRQLGEASRAKLETLRGHLSNVKDHISRLKAEASGDTERADFRGLNQGESPQT
jgi:hypothetical protein